MEANALLLTADLVRIEDALQRARDQLEADPDETGWGYVTRQILVAESAVAAGRLHLLAFLDAMQERVRTLSARY
jgi:hypothetical protein